MLSEIATAEQNPADVAAQIEAAYACDRHGDEHRAATFYEAAWRLGVNAPQFDRAGFLLGFGSTLKNVGRIDESEAILRTAIREFPADRALPVFLALTLHAGHRHHEALATAIETIVALSPVAPDIQRFARALAEYAAELHALA